MFLAHSLVLKLMVFGLPGTATFFASIGLPPWLAYAVFAAEAVGGAMLVLGVQAAGLRSPSPRCSPAPPGRMPATVGCSRQRVAAGNTRCS
jgi:hypothetical protein